MLKSSKTLCLILVIILLISLPAQAFFSFFKKKKPKELVHINEEILIQKNLEIEGELYPARIAIYIPRNENLVKVSTLYDELLQQPIISVKWITESQSKRSKEPKHIKAYKTEMQVLKQMEQMALAYDPTSAYDRIVEDKHVVNKSFLFNKTEIFTNLEKEFAHFLELEFPDNIKKQLRIDSKIYLRPEPVLNPQPTGKSQTKAPITRPNSGDTKPPSYLRPVQTETPQEQRNNQDQQMQELYEFEEAKRKLHTQETQFNQANPSDIELKQKMIEMQMMLDEGGSEEDEPLF